MKFAHIVNPVNVTEKSDLHTAQPITFESMKRARLSADKRLQIEFYCAQFKEDRCVVDADFTLTPDLQQSVQDFSNFATDRKLPLIGDIISRLYNATDAEYLIYTNVDIALHYSFYNVVAEMIDAGFDSFSITRRDVPAQYTRPEQLDDIYVQPGFHHTGYDCFVFRRDFVPKFHLGSICIGASFIGGALLANTVSQSVKPKVFRNKRLTFHVGQETVHTQPKNREYWEHNRKEYYSIVQHLLQQPSGQKLSDYFKSKEVIQAPLKLPFYYSNKLFYRQKNAYLELKKSKLTPPKQLSVYENLIKPSSTSFIEKKLDRRRQKNILSSRENDFVSCITFLESGHLMLINLLTKYFSKDVEFPNIDDSKIDYQCHKPIKAGHFHYCAGNNHCDYFGCNNPSTNFQQRHDLTLDTPATNYIKYIIQYRHPIESIVIWFANSVSTNQNDRDFHTDFHTHLATWSKYVQKWLLSHNANKINTLAVNYHNVISSPETELERIISFINPKENVDLTLIKSTASTINKNSQYNIMDSDYFDQSLFRTAEKSILPELQALGIAPLFSNRY